MEGALVRGKLWYDGESRLRGLSAGGLDLEILAQEEGLPSLVRMKAEEGWYFAGLTRRGNSIVETWYDEGGGILSLWVYETLSPGEDLRVLSRKSLLDPERPSESRYYFDGWGLLSAVESGDERAEVLYYREDLPRYGSVKNAGGERRFSFQWDEEGFLTRVSLSLSGADAPGEPAGAEEAGESAGEETPADYRYEYTLDERGNWIERREILMFRRGGLLVPALGEPVTRIIDYGDSE
jgi:hypothetical protein